MREITFSKALREALIEEMERDPNIILLGEDIGVYGGVFKVTDGLLDRFGPERVRETPISEAGFIGAAVGMAMTGKHPMAELMFMDFAWVAGDQIFNQAAKMRYMSGGRVKVPMVIRTQQGGGRGNAAQHSQSLETVFTHIPGLKVVVPSTPYDAKGLLKTAIRDENPVVFFEDKMMYNLEGPVPDEEYTIPFGVADIKRAGTDVTIVATSSMVHVALGAADLLSEVGISAEVIDPRTMYPLDTPSLVDSAKKTSRAIVVDEGYERYGVTAEIASVMADGAFYYLDAPVKRMGAMDVPVPFSPALEDLTVPTEASVADMAKTLCGKV
ncbi:MAG TPA: alpha-ketoacid dehydrogenase subunit beta [Chloroflexi bacterium]|nr:alpha-ketoacid dehydrogenase subunit beta [Chloroflexota bacterium]